MRLLDRFPDNLFCNGSQARAGIHGRFRLRTTPCSYSGLTNHRSSSRNPYTRFPDRTLCLILDNTCPNNPDNNHPYLLEESQQALKALLLESCLAPSQEFPEILVPDFPQSPAARYTRPRITQKVTLFFSWYHLQLVAHVTLHSVNASSQPAPHRSCK